MPDRDLLLVVGSNPPSQTSGVRTMGRVELARQILGFQRALLVNLFALPSYRSGGLTELGGSPEGWLDARPPLQAGLADADGVVLAYGTTAPGGAARAHYRGQLNWLDERIAEHGLPTWWVGGAPRHPSRWHRYTHRTLAGQDFPSALATALRPCETEASQL